MINGHVVIKNVKMNGGGVGNRVVVRGDGVNLSASPPVRLCSITICEIKNQKEWPPNI
jgi:hypothetical protein